MTQKIKNILTLSHLAVRPLLGAILFIGAVGVGPLADAQTTVTITNPIPTIVGGAGVDGVYPGYTNAQVSFTLTGGTDLVNLRVNVVGSPAGVTAGFVGGGLVPNSAANIATVTPATSSTNLFLSVAVSGAPKGSYPLEVIADNTVTLVSYTNYSTVLVLPVVYTATNLSTVSVDTNWSTDANWSLGAKPVVGDSVRFQYTNSTISAKNSYWDTSIVLDSLMLMPKASGLIATNFFADGVTVAVNGTNGFWAGADTDTRAVKSLFNFALVGNGGALVVTNPEAPFSMFSPITVNNDICFQNMSGLGKLYADVKRFGVGDGFLIYQKFSGTQPAEDINAFLAQTNIVRATYVGDYSGAGLMTNSIMFMNSAGNGSGVASTINLGISNAFYADSMSVISHQSAYDNSIFRFNPAFTNGYTAGAIFRGTNGGRMSYFGIGVESGGSGYTGRTRGTGCDFTGGTLDMVVNTLVLSQNQTNRNGNYTRGDLKYPMGSVNATTVRLGYQAPSTYTPTLTTGVRATLTVGGLGSNAVMTVSDTMRLMEGTFTETASGSTYVKININNGGKICVNNITWGTNISSGLPNNAGGSFISVNNGGQLIVTNTICNATCPLPAMTVQASGVLTLTPQTGVTCAYVSAFTDQAGSKINIPSIPVPPGTEATYVLIKYTTHTSGSTPIAIGTVPSGYNNVSVVDNTSLQQIELRVHANAPQVLRWKGYVNNSWNHTDANWQNTNTLGQVAFFDNDQVIFDDSASVTDVSVTDAVIPGSVTMTNGTVKYTFSNGFGSVGSATMAKTGVAAFTNNADTSLILSLQAGSLYGSGNLAGATLATNTTMSFAGHVNGTFTIQNGAVGTLLSGGQANGSLSIDGGGVFTNFGTIQGGSLTVSSNALLVNQTGGSLLNIGNPATVSGTLLNIGGIGVEGQKNNMVINGTFKDMGVSDIFLSRLTFNSGSKFIPGGDGIGTTEIKSATVAYDSGGYPGRLQLLEGSTTIIKVDFANAQTNSRVAALYTDFGSNTSNSQTNKSMDGCTVLMTNVNTGAGVFALGQGFQVFTGPAGGATLGNEGLNTTNRCPVVSPVIPVTNTKWDSTQIRDAVPNGVVNIVSFPTTATNFTTVTSYRDGTNMVTHLQWPSDYTGWRLEQQTNALSVGLQTATNKWTTVPGSASVSDIYITNDAAIETSFYRMAYP